MIQTVSIGSITLNDNANHFLTDAQGLGLPPVRLASFDVPGANDGRFVHAFYGRRRFMLRGTLVATDHAILATQRSLLEQAFDIGVGERTVTFLLSSGVTRTLRAVTRSFEPVIQAGKPMALDWAAELEAAFPFFTSSTEQTVTLTLGVSGGGDVPATIPMALNYGSGGIAVVTNAGSAVSKPTVRIHGPITNPTLRNNTTANELAFGITLGAGEFLDVDFRRTTVVDQGGRNRYETKHGTWWGIEPGQNTLRLIADSANQEAFATVTFSDTYLGL